MMTPLRDIATGAFNRSFLGLHDVPDAELETSLMEEVLATFGDSVSETVEAGTEIFAEGAHLDCLIFIPNGRVQLFRTMEGREVVFHRHSTGRVLGLLSVFNSTNAFFSCRALTPTTLMRITLADLETAMESNPALSILLTTTVLRTQARRSRRAVELQVELEQAQARLVKNEKMATLGQLSAGVAHELNNPIAAIARSADHLSTDVEALAAELSDDAAAADSLRRGLTATPLSTREERTLTRALASHLEADRMARRFVRIGLHTIEDVRALLGNDFQNDREATYETRLNIIEWCYQIGASLRNTKSCASRIVDLVSSLRSYGRPDLSVSQGVDVHRGLEETLLLLGHRLRDVEIVKEYADLPAITARPSELNQVWTNLLSNAIEALVGVGQITIATQLSDDEKYVVVNIIDTGPGIPEENLHRIFEVNFTTRQGLAGFGLGIGLPICREIVERHGGRISVSSKHGRTCFSVKIPQKPTQ